MKKAKLTKPGKKRTPGRPKGTPTVYCAEGAGMRENESRARYGKGSFDVAKESAAAGWVQQIGIQLAEKNGSALRFIRDQFAPKLLDRFTAGDVAFFENFAAAMRLPVGGAEKQQHAALLSYVRPKREDNPDRLFSRSELRDSVQWPKGYGVPDDRTLGRLTHLLGIPIQSGAPLKKSRAK